MAFFFLSDRKGFHCNNNLARFILFSCLNYETKGKWQEKTFSLPPYKIQSLVATSKVGQLWQWGQSSAAELRESSASWDKTKKLIYTWLSADNSNTLKEVTLAREMIA